jgi:hypothetical protein
MVDPTKVILASASPRRRQLLAAAGIKFEAIESFVRRHLPLRFQPFKSIRLELILGNDRDGQRAAKVAVCAHA